MTSRDFCFWLQGFLELRESDPRSNGNGLTSTQTESIARHLGLVFKHEIDPSAGTPQQQLDLNKIHNAGGGPTYRC